jgi:hypothetical protein
MWFFFPISALIILIAGFVLAVAQRPQFRAKIVCDDFFTLFMFSALILKQMTAI